MEWVELNIIIILEYWGNYLNKCTIAFISIIRIFPPLIGIKIPLESTNISLLNVPCISQHGIFCLERVRPMGV